MNPRNNDRPLYRERSIRSPISRPERNPVPVTPPPKAITPAPTPLPVQPATDPKQLAQSRKEFGFDDIPVDEDEMEEVRFRDILRAWAKQAIKHSPLEDKIKAAGKNSRLKELKNDLKWAIQADLDEPVAPVKKQPKPTPPPNVVADTSAAAEPLNKPPEALSKTIDININFGSLPKLPPIHKSTKIQAVIGKVRGFSWTRRRVIAAAAIVLVVSGSLVAVRLQQGMTSNKTASTARKTSGAAQSPTYTTLLPGGKTIDSLGGWHRVSPPDRDPVFAYVDKVGGVQVNVSQQPLPDNFKSDTSKNVAELAKSFNATEKVEVGNTTLYVGTSSKGPQSAIFAKDDTLILMKSQAKISNDAWTAYVESLK